MAGSETPVNPSNESSQHLKEDETPQSPVSEEWKKEKPKKEETKKVPQLVFSDCKSSGVQNFLYDCARFPVLDEDLIGERGQALDRDYGGGTRLTINHLKSNVTQSNIIQVPTNDTPAFSKVHPNQMSNIGRVPNYDTPASSTDHPNQMVPQFGVWEDGSEAGHNRWIGNVWKSIKNLVVKLVIVFKSLMYLFHCQVSWMKVKLVATYEDLIAERGRPLPRNHGRCRKLASKQPAD